MKQARGLLHFARWVQEIKNVEWAKSSSWTELLLVLIGPAGTGKPTLLRLVEALIEEFLGQESVQKATPSNTAARILGGDTVHALCKLPPGFLTGKWGHLSDGVLKKHRQRWKHARAFLLDEFSMLALDDYYKADIRIRQEKREPMRVLGGLGVSLSGDWLQLPSVDKTMYCDSDNRCSCS